MMDRNRLERLIAGEISKVSINCNDTQRCVAAIMNHLDAYLVKPDTLRELSNFVIRKRAKKGKKSDGPDCL